MGTSDQHCCIKCGRNLRPSAVKFNKKTCVYCIKEKRLDFYSSEQYLDTTFTSLWVKNLFKRLLSFLKEHAVPVETQARMLPKAAHVFLAVENTFSRPEEMQEEWVEEAIQKEGGALCPTFFRAFLIREHIISDIGRDKMRIEALRTKIETLPQGYQRLMEIYLNERLALRERQTRLNAKKVLSLRTIETDFIIFLRLVRWLTTNMPHLIGWDMIQEEHIQTFLLTLPAAHREIARGTLFTLFRLARKKRVVAHVPMAKYPLRRLPQTIEILTMEEQKVLAHHIRESIYAHPVESFLTVLCFYHGLTGSQIREIKTTDVLVEQGMIHIKGRTPIYLLAEDFLLLDQFLNKRKDFPYAKMRHYLFISNQNQIEDRPVGAAYISRKVSTFSGYTPQRLKVTYLAALSALYGPQYLVEACRISLTHASRYTKFQDFLLEEEVKQQREEFQELSRQLEQHEKQRTPRYQHQKEDVNHGSTE